ncbi:hypothetical protein GCM10009819_30530 [Agromyces tropicus]|uniref:MarR family transcriptional regulator n=1 Tax=Agromyces tropicus TaxID=555371 RepID=A0ABN2USS8_9MICO
MHTDLPYGTRLIGQTEKTLNAILERLLTGSGIGEREWVALTVLLQAGPDTRTAASARVAAALKLEPRDGATVIDALASRDLVSTTVDGVRASDAGRALHADVRARVDELVERLWGDIPSDERAAAASVLNRTLRRAADELDALRA